MASEGVRRIGRDLRQGRNIEAYVATGIAAGVAVLSLVGDLVPDGVRWSAALGALGLLVFHLTVPDPAGGTDQILRNRQAFDDAPAVSRFRKAREVWVFGPSAVNLLSASLVDELRRSVLTRPDGRVRIAILDPEATEAVELARCQLDEAVEHPVSRLPEAIATTAGRLRTMATWDVAGQLEYRFVAYNPGFSIVAVDPHGRDGAIIVEFHGFHNVPTGGRMHIELRRGDSVHWYEHWFDQFEALWSSARPDTPPRPPTP